MAARRESEGDSVERLIAEIEALEREAEVCQFNLTRDRDWLYNRGTSPGRGVRNSNALGDSFRKPIIMPDSYDGRRKWDH